MPSPSTSPEPGRADPRRDQLAELMQTRQELAALRSEIATLKSERQAQRDELGSARARIAELESASRAEGDMRRQLSEVHGKTVAGLRERMAELESKVEKGASLRTRMVELEEDAAERAELEVKVSDLEKALESERSKVSELQAKLAERPAESAGAGHDDLKNIRGVGPKYEKALKALGVTSLRQIADWTPSDIEAFAEKLKLKPERIVKDDWVGRARKLCEPDQA
ncbi:MAG TPA: hypothetical protein VGP93_13215 [Polyangiaceae bacterium]|nr:hypothetical protein [Polyangiaceae bacterium]